MSRSELSNLEKNYPTISNNVTFNQCLSQIFDSHREWSWDYSVYCKDKMNDGPFMRTQYVRFFMRRRNCRDRWHAGWHLTVPMARLVINHVCAEAGVTDGKTLHLHFA